MCTPGTSRWLTVTLLVALLLVLAPAAAQAEEAPPLTQPPVRLPAGANVFTPRGTEPAVTTSAPPGLEDRLARIAAAYLAGDRAQLKTAAGNPDVDLAAGTARVILEMAEPPATHLVSRPESPPRVMVDASLAAAIAATGATYETAYGNWVQALAPLGSLTPLAELSGVTRVRLPFPTAPAALPAPAVAAPAAPLAGPQTSEGVSVTGAAAWHTAGFTGAGVSLAVFDPGFSGWSARQTAGDLPPGARLVLKDFSATYNFTPDAAGFEHGTACAEIAYDMAPSSTVYLYAFGTEVELGNAVTDYINNVTGKKVATMSVGYANAGPYDGTGPINAIVDAARNAGIFWASAAGNSQKTHYSGLSVQSPGTDYVAFGTGVVEAFGEAPGWGYPIPAGTEITAYLEWNDWNAGRTGNQNHTDYDLTVVVYDTFFGWWTPASGTGSTSTENQCTTSAPPMESIEYIAPAQGYYGIVISRNLRGGACANNFGHWLTLHSWLSAGAKNLFWYVNECNSLQIPADGDSAVAAGAAFWNEDTLSPLYGLEPFSSCGPRNAPGGGQPAGTVDKPDVVAPDGVSTGIGGASNGINFAGAFTGFFGTSSAAPHTAGLAATLWSGRPDLTLAQLRSLIQNQAVTKGDGGACGANGKQNSRYGWGRIAAGPLPPAAPNPVSITRSGNNALLTWSHLAVNVGGYQVWWSSQPYFTPGSGPNHAAVTAAPWQYEHVGTPGANYYYVVLGVNGAGVTSGASNQVGKFQYTLVPGQ